MCKLWLISLTFSSSREKYLKNSLFHHQKQKKSKKIIRKCVESFINKIRLDEYLIQRNLFKLIALTQFSPQNKHDKMRKKGNTRKKMMCLQF